MVVEVGPYCTSSTPLHYTFPMFSQGLMRDCHVSRQWCMCNLRGFRRVWFLGWGCQLGDGGWGICLTTRWETELIEEDGQSRTARLTAVRSSGLNDRRLFGSERMIRRIGFRLLMETCCFRNHNTQRTTLPIALFTPR